MFFEKKIKHFSSPQNAELNEPIANVKYSDMNEKIERASKFYYVMVTRYNTLLFYSSSLFATVIDYLVHGLGNESYHLRFGILYAHLKMHFSRFVFDSFETCAFPFI